MNYNQKIRIASVQSAPAFLNRQGSTDKTLQIIAVAAQNGARIIGFPEGYIPSHPAWVEMLPCTSSLSLELYQRLFENAVEVPGPEVESIQHACRIHNIYAVVGINERLPQTTGTLYNTQIIIGCDGKILNKHQKYVPTVGERLVHTYGKTGYKASVRTPIGGISGLICGENSNPLGQYAIGLDYPLVHVASWPQHFDVNLDMRQVIPIVSRGLAYSLKCYVLNSVALVDEDAISSYVRSSEDLAFVRSFMCSGMASIIGPSGNIVASCDSYKDDIAYADVSLQDLIVPKLIHDVAGHYSRPEMFAEIIASSQ